jgi:hypothetical protein
MSIIDLFFVWLFALGAPPQPATQAPDAQEQPAPRGNLQLDPARRSTQRISNGF